MMPSLPRTTSRWLLDTDPTYMDTKSNAPCFHCDSGPRQRMKTHLFTFYDASRWKMIQGLLGSA